METKTPQFLYPVSAKTLAYTRNANAYQKLALVAGMDNGWIVVPRGYDGFAKADFGAKVIEEGDPRIDVRTAVWCRPVSNETTMLAALWDRFVRRRRYVAFCWDPPGVARRDSRRGLDALRCRLMDILMERVIRHSEGMALNLHPGFLEGRFSECARRKVRAFPNGTMVAANQEAAKGAVRRPKRISVSSQFSESKGCWEVVKLIGRLWREDAETEFLWLGNGPAFEAVRARLRELGCEGPRMMLTGKIPLAESMRLQGTCSLAVCLYRDVPSLRWNYVLKAPEALSLGLPLAAFRLPGICEYVEDGVTGLLADDGRTGELAERILALLNDGTRLAAMRANCLARAPAYDWGAVNADIRAFVASSAFLV